MFEYYEYRIKPIFTIESITCNILSDSQWPVLPGVINE